MCIQCRSLPKSGLYQRLFARIYDPFMRGIEQQVFLPKRRQLLEGLRGNILEIGAGTGVNFPIYGKDAAVLAVEPSAAMLTYAKKRMDREPMMAKILLKQGGIGYSEWQEFIPEGGFDAIVCTLVLCSVPAPEAAIVQLATWLKPGGKLVVLEHIRPQKGWKKLFYRWFNPVWQIFSEGCSLTRSTDQLLRNQGFVAEWENYFQVGLPFYEGRLLFPVKA